MNGKWLALGIGGIAAVAGGAMYYLQVYYYYERLDPVSVVITTTDANGAVTPLAVRDIQAIDANSSPIRFRACFQVDGPVEAVAYPAAEPLTAPEWFSCFDAEAIGEALETGEATAYLGAENHPYGIDVVLAVLPDGRGYAWRQINACGEKAFDGEPVPEGCPEPPAE